MMDFLDTKADKKISDEYVDAVNKLELKRGGAITSLERSQLLFDMVQKKALEIFKDDKAPDSLLQLVEHSMFCARHTATLVFR